MQIFITWIGIYVQYIYHETTNYKDANKLDTKGSNLFPEVREKLKKDNKETQQ